MELTEQQALEIAYSNEYKNRWHLKTSEHKFLNLKGIETVGFNTNYDYVLEFYIGKFYDGHNTNPITITFYFSDTHSAFIINYGVEIDITDFVNNYLNQHKAGAGV